MNCFRIGTLYVMATGVITGVMAMGLCASVAAAAAQDPLTGLRSCVKDADDAQRLACFDKEMARLESVPPAALTPAAPPAPQVSPTPAAAPVPAAPAGTSEDRFGYRGVMARKEVDQRNAEIGAVGQLTSTVTDISTLPHGEMIITLANGQVWAQIAPEAFFRLKVSDPVTIKAGALNSFTLYGPKKRSTKVTRQQ